MQKLSIYIHIPFCMKKCFYCDFLSFQADEKTKDRYIQALLTEIEAEAEKYADYQVDTVFIGGGTPSVLPGNRIAMIMDRLRALFSFTGQPEMTIEVNPGTVTYEKLAHYRAAGINRISIGTQSVHDRELAMLGRIHTAEDFFSTYRMAEAAGFTNINVDIMSALPGQTVEDYTDTLLQIAELQPEHISAYSLIIEEGTCFYKLYGEGRKNIPESLPLPSEEEDRIMYEQTEKILKSKGYHRYEISNYARSGKECRHNIAYWRRYDYVGFGIGAASMADNVRWKNISDMEEYIRRLESGETAVKEEWQQLSIGEQMEEFMFLGLRLTEGVEKKEFFRLFKIDIEDIYGEVIRKLCKQGLLLEGANIQLTAYGRDVSNYVMAEFLL